MADSASIMATCETGTLNQMLLGLSAVMVLSDRRFLSGIRQLIPLNQFDSPPTVTPGSVGQSYACRSLAEGRVFPETRICSSGALALAPQKQKARNPADQGEC
jgi:hypothetical protein